MNLLLVGFGKIGKRYFSILKKKKVKIIILRKKKFKSKKFTNKLPNLEKISAAIICSPLGTHDFYSKKLIKHNIPFIIEKPISKSISHIKYLENESKKKKISIMVNYSDLFDPNFIPLLELAKKKSKHLINMNLNYGNNKNHYHLNNPVSPFEDWLPHPISVILYLFKKIDKFRIVNYSYYTEKYLIFQKIRVKFVAKKKIINLNFSNYKNSNMRNINLKFKDSEINFDSYKKNKNFFKNKSNKVILNNENMSFDNIVDIFLKNVKKNIYKSNIKMGLLEAKISRQILKKVEKYKN